MTYVHNTFCVTVSTFPTVAQARPKTFLIRAALARAGAGGHFIHTSPLPQEVSR